MHGCHARCFPAGKRNLKISLLANIRGCSSPIKISRNYIAISIAIKFLRIDSSLLAKMRVRRWAPLRDFTHKCCHRRMTFEEVRRRSRIFKPWLRFYEANLHPAIGHQSQFLSRVHKYPHLPYTFTHTRALSGSAYVIPVIRSILTHFSRSTRGVESVLLANQDDQTSIAETIGPRGHPTMPSDRLI